LHSFNEDDANARTMGKVPVRRDIIESWESVGRGKRVARSLDNNKES
jgi:hypothetical protein